MKKNGEFVGVDDKFIPENEEYVDESLLGNKEESKRKIIKVAKGIGIGYLIFLGIGVAIVVSIFIFIGSMFFKIGGQTEVTGNLIDKVGSQIESQINKEEVDSFNRDFEGYSGTSPKMYVNSILDNVVKNNKKNSDKIITVVYNETTTTDPNEIFELKPSFEQGKNYEVMLDYGTNGLVNKVTIKDI